MELSIENIKKDIANIIGNDLIADGFKLDKSNTWYTKKINKNKVKIFVDCYNYKPIKIEFRLIFQIWIDEIIKEKEKFHRYLNEPFLNEWPIFSFCEGDFYKETKHLEHKYRNAYTHIIESHLDVEREILACKKLLYSEILPSLNDFTSLELFQSFVLNNYQSLSLNYYFIPSMIAMKLKGINELRKVVDYYWNVYGLKDYGNAEMSKIYARNIILFAEGIPASNIVQNK